MTTSHKNENQRGEVSDGFEKSKQALVELKDTVTEKVGKQLDAAKHTVHDAGERAGDVLASAGHSISTTVKENPIPVAMIGVGVVGAAWLTWCSLGEDEGRASTSRMGSMKAMTRDTTQSVERFVRDNPLLAGAACIAAGAALGAALPRTARENRWMGDRKQRVVSKVRDVTRSALDKVEDVAHAVSGGGEDEPRALTH